MPMSFRLSDKFVDTYATRPVDWGYPDAAGNTLGEITYLRSYSRLKEDGTKERWHETCRRVIEGMFSLQKDHVKAQRLPWSDIKAQRAAEDAFERLFTFKWTPPGRGLAVMGTPLVHEHRNSAALQSCAFVSTAGMSKTNPAEPFEFLMDASLLGVGVGFDVFGADLDAFHVHSPAAPTGRPFLIPDTREGWTESTSLLIRSYLMPDRHAVEFDYSAIRPAGAPIRTFGGTAAGAGPLIRLHRQIRELLDAQVGLPLSSQVIMDIANMIGVCVVSGNVRRSALLALGSADDDSFVTAKDYTKYPHRVDYGYMSNNSVAATVDQDLSGIADSIRHNGEPGVVWLDLARSHGRLADPADNRDHRVAGVNPCSEQTLESYETCCLVEVHLNRIEDIEDLRRTLKVAYLYGKTVTLLPTHWPRTNAIMQRNRRIGTSITGMADFADNSGIVTLRDWLEEGYATVRHYDTVYSEWLGVRESIKVSSVKPSGTVSILSGASPGVHWTPGGQYFERRIRFAANDPMVAAFRSAGYPIEPAAENPDYTVVVTFPVRSDAKRSEREVSIFEKAHLAALAQRHWSDNAVSVTVSFDPETEGRYIGAILSMYAGQLKAVSFLPMATTEYAQPPYTQISADRFDGYAGYLLPIDLTAVYHGQGREAEGEKYCTTDVCELKAEGR